MATSAKRAAKGRRTVPATAAPSEASVERSEASVQYEQRAELHERICELMADGLTARAACAQVGVPFSRHQTWVYRGVVDGERYARAMQTRAHVLAEEVVTVADRDDLDPADKKVRVDARKWSAARMDPKRWGDRLDVTSGDQPLGGVVVLPVIQVVTPHGPSLEVAQTMPAPAPNAALQALQRELPADSPLLR